MGNGCNILEKTGRRHKMDLKTEDTVQLTLTMPQIEYQINPMYTSQEIFDECSDRPKNKGLNKFQSLSGMNSKMFKLLTRIVNFLGSRTY